MLDCTFSYIPICLCLCALFCVIGIFKDSFEQCKIQQRKERIENNKQLLLNNLEQGQCGDVCIKESDSKHSTRYEHYTMCDVSIKVCKD